MGDNSLLFEVGDNEQQFYMREHLPGALYLNTNCFERAPDWNILPARELEPALLALGITSQKTVHLYGRNRWAVARTALALLYAGVADVRWVTSGKAAWKAAGNSLETGQNLPTPAHAFGGAFPGCPEYIVDLEQTRTALTDPGAVVADVRSWDEYSGQVSGYSYIDARGRIPGSAWIGEAPEKVHAASVPGASHQRMCHMYKEVVSAWSRKGVTSERQVIFYCGTGWRASEAFWIARVMSWKQISVYDGGWLEWSRQGDFENKL